MIKADLKRRIYPLQPSEGVLFDIYDRAGLLQALATAGFNVNTPFGGAHVWQVGGNIFTISDNRSPTVGNGNLGSDSNSNGNVRSLQVVAAKTNKRGETTGYADLDCDNPAQDVVGFARHSAPIVGRAIGRFFGRLF